MPTYKSRRSQGTDRDSVYSSRAIFIDAGMCTDVTSAARRGLEELGRVFRVVVVGKPRAGAPLSGAEIIDRAGEREIVAYARRISLELYASYYIGRDAPDLGFVLTFDAAKGLARAVGSIRGRESRSPILVGQESLPGLVASLRKKGKRIVVTNGVFDLVHIGHLRLLEAARRLGDVLIVAINSDDSTRAIKGEARPVVPQFARAQTLTALRCVDYCCIFTETDPRRVLAVVRPDVLAKGSDYSLRGVVGGTFVTGYGGRVELLPLIRGCSTTSTITRINTRRPGQ